MLALTESALLPRWEEGERTGPLGRETLLLATAAPDLRPEELEELTIGQRNAALLEIHARAFGERLEGFVRCPACDEPLEVQLAEEQVRSILASEPTVAEHELAAEGHEVRFRLVTCGDLEAAAGAMDTAQARSVLVERCVVEARRDREPVAAADLPESVVVALAERLATLDPQAEISLAVSCPECEHEWRAAVDAASFLWSRVSLAARRLLEEVHVLATSYGWTEADVLALSRRRRRAYLELALS